MIYFLILAGLLLIAAPVIGWMWLPSLPPPPLVTTSGSCRCNRCGENFNTTAGLVAHRVWADFPSLRARLLRQRTVRCMTCGELYANFTAALFGDCGKLIWRRRA